jgi:hypothetical protein
VTLDCPSLTLSGWDGGMRICWVCQKPRASSLMAALDTGGLAPIPFTPDGVRWIFKSSIINHQSKIARPSSLESCREHRSETGYYILATHGLLAQPVIPPSTVSTWPVT